MCSVAASVVSRQYMHHSASRSLGATDMAEALRR